jgi:hypothetical protein
MLKNFTQPTQPKKRAQWQQARQRVQQSGVPSQAVSMSWQRRGMRELSCEIKIEWEKI